MRRRDAAILQRAVGCRVTSVSIELLFYKDEAEGSLGDVALRFADGSNLFLGCAGDGSIFVTQPTKIRPGAAPGITVIERHIQMEGELKEVVASDDSLQLVVDSRTMKLTNDDDQMVVLLDGLPLPADVFRR